MHFCELEQTLCPVTFKKMSLLSRGRDGTQAVALPRP